MSSWDLPQGIKRLGYLPVLLPGPVLDGVPAGLPSGPIDLGVDPGPDVFLLTLKNYAYSTIDGELMVDRMDRWRSLGSYEGADPWIALAPHEHLRDYESLLRDYYQCDNQALWTLRPIDQMGT